MQQRRIAVLDAIVVYKQAHDGNSPTIRYLAEATGLTTSQVHKYLGDLSELGAIRLAEGSRAAAIEVVGGRWSVSWSDHDRAKSGDDGGRVPRLARSGRAGETHHCETIR